MYDMNPHPISIKEWEEIVQIREVREGWGLDDEKPEEFANMVYGVRFQFVSGSPGYIGDLFIIQSDHLTGDAPMILTRERGTGKLSLDYWEEVIGTADNRRKDQR